MSQSGPLPAVVTVAGGQINVQVFKVATADALVRPAVVQLGTPAPTVTPGVVS